jgi:hypothetical protein
MQKSNPGPPVGGAAHGSFNFDIFTGQNIDTKEQENKDTSGAPLPGELKGDPIPIFAWNTTRSANEY